jgi:ribosomal-protein-alanine N-acetyltransferase
VLEELELEGEVVRLRPVRAEDAERCMEEVGGREEVLRWLCWAGPESVEQLRERYSNWRRGGEDGLDYELAICDAGADRMVGAVTLRFQGHPGQGDVGYWVAVDRWGRGYAGEAVRLLTDFAFRHGLADVLYGWVFVGNEASRRVLEKAGYTLEYTTRKSVAKHGREVEQWYLVQTASEWSGRTPGPPPRSERFRLAPSSRPDGGGGSSGGIPAAPR